MKRLPDEVIRFFQEQGFVIVSTVDKGGMPHSACKGIIRIDRCGRVYLLDLYRAKTRWNLKSNPHISITAVDEHKFKGYCLKGRGQIVSGKKIGPHIIKAWHKRITSRLTKRVLRNMYEGKSYYGHPEALLPEPEYLIAMNVEEIVDLTPQHLK